MNGRKIALTTALAAIVFSATFDSNADKMSVSMRQMLLRQAGGASISLLKKASDADSSQMLYVRPESSALVPAVLTVSNEFDSESLEGMGFVTSFRFGNRIHGSVAANRVEEICHIPGIVEISAPEESYLNLDYARRLSGVDKAQGTEAVDDSEWIPFTGKGVVIGMVDAGIDPTHIAFAPLEGEEFRVKKYVRTYSAAETENHRFVADFYSTKDEIYAAPIDEAARGHGTHTSGIASGSFRGNPYYGVAPDADLYMVSLGELLYDDEIEFGIGEALYYALRVGKPVVVSLSLGSTFGNHTGHNNITDMMAYQEMKGKAIVFAAGNDGMNKCSILHQFNGGDTEEEIATIMLTNNSGIPVSGNIMASSCGGKKFDIALSVLEIQNNEATELCRTEFIPASEFIGYDEGAVLPLLSSIYDCAFPELAEHFDAEIYILPSVVDEVFSLHLYYKRNTDDRNLRPTTPGIIVRSEDGAEVLITVPGNTVQLANMGLAGYSEGNGYNSISDNCTSPYVISVGAWNARSEWTSLSGEHFEVDEESDQAVAYYSSYGKNVLTGEQLPHVIAPGSNVCSAFIAPRTEAKTVAVYSTPERDYYFGLDSGTSMSTPVVSGIIALWLQAKPDLTREEMLEILEATSNYDSRCEEKPLAAGMGKIDAYAGLKKILTENSVANPSENTPSTLMVKRLSDRKWECIVPVAGASGVASVYSLDGREIFRTTVSKSQCNIDLSTIADGIYIVNASTNKGRYSYKLSAR